MTKSSSTIKNTDHHVKYPKNAYNNIIHDHKAKSRFLTDNIGFFAFSNGHAAQISKIIDQILPVIKERSMVYK